MVDSAEEESEPEATILKLELESPKQGRSGRHTKRCKTRLKLLGGGLGHAPHTVARDGIFIFGQSNPE